MPHHSSNRHHNRMWPKTDRSGWFTGGLVFACKTSNSMAFSKAYSECVTIWVLAETNALLENSRLYSEWRSRIPLITFVETSVGYLEMFEATDKERYCWQSSLEQLNSNVISAAKSRNWKHFYKHRNAKEPAKKRKRNIGIEKKGTTYAFPLKQRKEVNPCPILEKHAENIFKWLFPSRDEAVQL